MKPTITWGKGILDDCDTDYSANRGDSADPLTNPSLTVYHGDMFKISGTADSAADEWLYYRTGDLSGDAVSTANYPYYLVRYKTSASANALGAKVDVYYTDNDSEVILGSDAPQFSTTWTTHSGEFTKSKTIKYIRFYADDYPNSVADGPHHVYYDFVLIHKGTFTFPRVKPGGVTLNLPYKLPRIDIPGRDGDVIQMLGMKSPEITVTTNMEAGETWGSLTGASADNTALTFGEYLYYILRDSDAWQWFESDLIKCKVTPAPEGFSFAQLSDSGSQRVCTLKFLMYSLSSLSELTWDTRQWFGY